MVNSPLEALFESDPEAKGAFETKQVLKEGNHREPSSKKQEKQNNSKKGRTIEYDVHPRVWLRFITKHTDTYPL
jgi:hypothetical protein